MGRSGRPRKNFDAAALPIPPDGTPLEPIQIAFLKAYAITGHVSEAGKAINMPGQKANGHHANWTKNPTYKQAFEIAKLTATETLEREADRRAREGVQRVVIQKGEPVFGWYLKDELVPPGTPGAVQKAIVEHNYSDILMIFRLKALKPEMYRDNATLDVTSNGQPLKQFVNLDTSRV